jgi:hypothetical protein
VPEIAINIEPALDENVEQRPMISYKLISPGLKILRGSYHQGSNIFNDNYVGVQFCAMVLANIIRASILSPNLWSTNVVNENLIADHALYVTIREKSCL